LIRKTSSFSFALILSYLSVIGILSLSITQVKSSSSGNDHLYFQMEIPTSISNEEKYDLSSY